MKSNVFQLCAGALYALLAAITFVLLHISYQIGVWSCYLCSGRNKPLSCAGPPHFAAAFDISTPDSTDLAAARVSRAVKDAIFLINLCAESGVSQLSIFDKDGILAAALCDSLYRYTSSSQDPNISLTLAWANKPAQNLDITTDIPVKSKALRINLLSAHDDKPAIAAAAQGGHTVESVSDTLRKRGPLLSDPDILAVQNKTRSLCGFPCWYIRTTSVLFVDSWDKRVFNDACTHYHKNEQRFGA